MGFDISIHVFCPDLQIMIFSVCTAQCVLIVLLSQAAPTCIFAINILKNLNCNGPFR